MFFGDGTNGHKFANAGVRENNIDSSFYLCNSLVETIKVGQFGNVSLNARNVATDCLHGLVDLLLAPTRDEDVATLVDAEFGLSQPNPSPASADYGYLARLL